MELFSRLKQRRCPNCGAVLDDLDFTCPNCGALQTPTDFQWEIIGEGLRRAVVSANHQHCENCNADLEIQEGFDENESGTWVCTECGYENEIAEDEEDDESDPSDDNYDNNDIGYDLDGESFYDNSGQEYEEEEDKYEDEDESEEDPEQYHKRLEKEERRRQRRETRKERKREFRRKHWKGILIAWLIVILLIAAGIGYLYISYQKSLIRKVPFSSEEAIGQTYEHVESMLETAGFTDINSEDVDDLTINERDEEYLVTSIQIGEDTEFFEGTEYKLDTPITITYHTIKPVESPYSNEDVRKKPYEDIVQSMKDAGFVNIQIKAKRDLITGWITKRYSIASVTIDGDDEFYEGEYFQPDAEVVITYHDFKE